jgi:4-azaleucine resistance transporter AzlC
MIEVDVTQTVETPAVPRSFTRAGLFAGAVSALALIPGVVLFGVAFGTLAGQRGLTTAEAILMSVMVCAGTAQFAALQEWTSPAPVLAAALTSLALNSRYVLLGASARPWFAGVPPAKAYLSMFVMYDGNWALSAREQEAGRKDAAHLLGGGLMLCAVWTMATGAGHAFGALLGDGRQYGLDFVLVSFFAALLVDFFKGRSDILVAAVAVVVAIAVERLVPGPWYMIAGALAGSTVAALSYDRAGAR